MKVDLTLSVVQSVDEVASEDRDGRNVLAANLFGANDRTLAMVASIMVSDIKEQRMF